MFLAVDEDLPDHPKSLRLCAKLMNPLGWAYVIKLWRWATKFAKDGDLTEFAAEEIEIGLGWTLDTGKLYSALLASGFLETTGDGRVVIHDWMEHQGKWLAKMEADRHRSANRRGTVRGPSADYPETSQDGPKTSAVPNLTKPNLTKQTKPEDPDACAETAPPSSPPVLEFPTDGPVKSWPLTEDAVSRWREQFPSLDVLGECRKALAWVEASPPRRKTTRGMSAFLVSWFSRAQDRGGGARAGPNGGRAKSDGNVETLGNWLRGTR